MCSRPLVVTVALALAAPVSASAQETTPEGFDAHGFHLSAFDGDLRDPLTLQRPGRFKQGEWFAGGVVEYANAPLIRNEPDTNGNYVSRDIVDDLVAVNTSFGYALHDRIRVDVAAPLYVHYADYRQDFTGVAMGDIRTTAMVALVRPEAGDTGVGLGLTGHVDIPTGDVERFLGNRTVAGGTGLAFSAASERLTLTASAGMQFNPTVNLDNLQGVDAATTGLGLGFKVHETTSLNLESRVQVPIRRNAEAGTNTPAEGIFTVRHRRKRGGHILAGASAGMTPGASAARFRAFLGGGFGKVKQTFADLDLDGIADADDACPRDPENFNGYQDVDGCPEHGVLLADVIHDGERASGAILMASREEEHDTVRITDTAARFDDPIPGKTWNLKATMGDCLEGQANIEVDEGDNVVDVHLAPRRTGSVRVEVVDANGNIVPEATATWSSAQPGCVPDVGITLDDDGRARMGVGPGEHVLYIDAPQHAIHAEHVSMADGEHKTIRIQLGAAKTELRDNRIVILDKVHFETDKAVIRTDSYELLDEVAHTIKAYDLGHIEVAGHTDDTGADAYNQSLSERRAAAVRDYLIAKGVTPDALTSHGYGEDVPIASNDTEEGRLMNRRVSFTVMDSAE